VDFLVQWATCPVPEHQPNRPMYYNLTPPTSCILATNVKISASTPSLTISLTRTTYMLLKNKVPLFSLVTKKILFLINKKTCSFLLFIYLVLYIFLKKKKQIFSVKNKIKNLVSNQPFCAERKHWITRLGTELPGSSIDIRRTLTHLAKVRSQLVSINNNRNTNIHRHLQIQYSICIYMQYTKLMFQLPTKSQIKNKK
jgi:hypothetical protein